jgi:hypothetical protein
MSASDCPICQEQISKAACGRCMHKFCYECLLTWCTAHNGCPTCRADLEFIALDPTFDAVVEELVANGSTSNKGGAERSKSEGDSVTSASDIDNLTIDYRNGVTSGVRIAVKSGPGVRVTGVWRSGAFYAAGLRPGDVIYELNGFPCNDIRVAIDVINAAQLGCKKLTLRMHSKRASVAQKRKGSLGTMATSGPSASLLRLLHKAVARAGSRNGSVRGHLDASGPPQDPDNTTSSPESQEGPEGFMTPEDRPRRQPRRPASSRNGTDEDQEWQWWEEGELLPPSESYREGSTNRQLRNRLLALGRSAPGLAQPAEELPQRESPWLQTTTLDA